MKNALFGLILFAGLLEAQGRITINAGQRFQTIQGFGVNFNGTYYRAEQKPLLDLLIDDLGATIFRLDPYGLTNWESRNDNDDPKAMNWAYYNDRYSIPAFEASWEAARYLNSRGIRPFLTVSGIAPEWMLGPGQVEGKRVDQPVHLKPEMYAEFAETVVSLALYARNKARIDYRYFSPVNETDCPPREGPGIDESEMPAVLNAIADRMRREGLGDVRLVVAEQCRMNANFIGPLLNQPELMKQVGAVSLHSYGQESIAPHVEKVRASAYPDVPVWLTEYGDLNDQDFSAANEWTNFCLRATDRALRALNEGASVALFWDAFDNFHEHDQRMTYYGLVRNSDHLYAPKKRYYAARQLYRFVRPGFQRIAAQADVPGMLVSAYRNADGGVVVVGTRRGGPRTLRIEGLPEAGVWEVYQTTPLVDCLKTDRAEVKNGVAEIQLADASVFTLVGAKR